LGRPERPVDPDAGPVQRFTLWDGDLTHRLGVLPSVFPDPPSNGSPEAVGALAFSPDGHTLYATSAHIPLQPYPVNPSYAATWICAHTASYRGVCPASG
jgi:hypothetical protein